MRYPSLSCGATYPLSCGATCSVVWSHIRVLSYLLSLSCFLSSNKLWVGNREETNVTSARCRRRGFLTAACNPGGGSGQIYIPSMDRRVPLVPIPKRRLSRTIPAPASAARRIREFQNAIAAVPAARQQRVPAARFRTDAQAPMPEFRRGWLHVDGARSRARRARPTTPIVPDLPSVGTGNAHAAINAWGYQASSA